MVRGIENYTRQNADTSTTTPGDSATVKNSRIEVEDHMVEATDATLEILSTTGIDISGANSRKISSSEGGEGENNTIVIQL